MKSRLIDIALIFLFILVGYGFHTFVNSINLAVPVSSTEVNIEGDTEYGLGDLADFSAITNNNIELVSDWKVIKNNKEVKFKVVSSNNIIFPVGIEKANIQLLFHGSYIDQSTQKIKTTGFIVKNINVGGSPLPPTPDPPQPKPDNPIIPDGKYKIAQTAYTTAVALVQSGKLPDAAAALSKSYNDIAKNIRSGNYSTLRQAYDDLKDSNDAAFKAVNEDKQFWQSWDNAMQKIISNLHNTQKLKLSDHADILSEIAIGLSYIK